MQKLNYSGKLDAKCARFGFVNILVGFSKDVLCFSRHSDKKRYIKHGEDKQEERKSTRLVLAKIKTNNQFSG